MALYISNQVKVLLKYVLQAEMFLTVKKKISSLLRAWIHLEYSFIQNNLFQIGGNLNSEFMKDSKTEQVGRRRMQILQRE